MSPEQARGVATDARTDIWAFGCLLYELLTGRAAFAASTVSDTIAAILKSEPDWTALPEETSPAVPDLIRHCLAKDAARRLQNIADARPALQEAASGQVARSIPTRDDSGPSIHSLVVLPFVNVAGDPEMEYLSDGLTESIIVNLSHLPQLRVIARASAFRYKGRENDAQNIGGALGVEGVVTGRVLQRGGTLVVSAELLEVANGWQLWGAQYKKTATDIFATEEEIAREITAKLRLKLTPEKEKLLAKRYTENVDAYHLYLKGKFYWGKRTQEGLKKGLEYFRQALEVDPTYALAYAGLAEGYVPMGFYGHMRPAEVAQKARAAARKALDIDPMLSEARTVLATIQFWSDWDAPVEHELRLIITEDPNYGRARQDLSELCTALGRSAEAIAEANRALDLDPLSLAMNTHVALTLYYARHYKAAIEQARKTVDMDPTFYPAHWVLGLAYEQELRLPEARTALQEAVKLSGNSTFMLATLAAACAGDGQVDECRRIMHLLATLAHDRYVSPVLDAEVHAALGDTERALATLDRAVDERDPKLAYVRVNPRFDRLRSDLRFQAVVRRVWTHDSERI